MTAFASQTKNIFDQGIATCEIRAVNHRYLDMQFRLSATVAHLEPLLRNKLRDQVKRGRIEVRLNYKPIHQTTNFNFNEQLATQLLAYCERVRTLNDSCDLPNTLDLLKWPDILQSPEDNRLGDSSDQACITLFENATSQLLESRAIEGQKIREKILERLHQLEIYHEQILSDLPRFKENNYQRLMNRFNEAKLQVEPQRFEQELVFMLQKSDISEELDRLKIHLTTCHDDLTQTSVKGARLDFLMQELNREVNTIASKSNHAQLTLQAVDMKVLIEEMREQIQNIE
jgi:uncharacterized protein (TIGR00255 family)